MEDRVYHIPVLLDQTIQGLSINPNGVYVDVTFGGGGHSIEILNRLDQGRLLAFDQDPDALANVPENEKFTLIPQNFKHLKSYLKLEGVREIDGLLADLGVSSHQFDEGSRGFSLRFEGRLDMRMNPKDKLDAHHIINSYSFEDLCRIFRQYGEVKNPVKIVNTILRTREERTIDTTKELTNVIDKSAPRGKELKHITQIFQALRIEVNGELEALKQLLEQSKEIMKIGGRIAVISYHSLEDRLVKNFLRSGNFDGKIEKDFFGNMIRPFKPLQSKAIVANEEEIEKNSRARSARLRIAERVDEKRG